jgi:hypothetical protein
MSLTTNTGKKLSKSLQKKEIEYNRSLAKKAVLLSRIRREEQSDRRSRTRTLIQIGGLVFTTPLTELCDISEGDDLQDLEFNKGALLAGILCDMLNTFPLELTQEKKDFYTQVGINHLKKRAYEKDLKTT